MKKFLKFLMVIGLFLITGCGSNEIDSVFHNFQKKVNDASSYYLEGVMKIINQEDTYSYDVKVSFQKDDYYKVELVNQLNNHEQVILRNDDGVYVVTH